ncbi:MAG: tRNA adenosine(34) deaminase TadA [Synergistaceae bacterium]|jgi:tRNA(adenine34) deaminase|nr:tRNA adenosine(34) deaminase TadA [Synergistaceae bacterium]
MKLDDATRDDLYFMREALNEARAALSCGEIPVGAVLVSENEIIGRGFNRRVSQASPFAHAETRALEDAGKRMGNWRFDGCALYVTLEPCPMCAGAIVQTRVARVVYGAADPKAGAGGTLYDILRDPRMPHRCSVTALVLADESREMLREFFQSKRRAPL